VPIQYAGKTYPVLDPEKFTPGETDAIERAVGMSFPKIRRMGDTCVCEHSAKQHDAETRACTLCSCDSHESDMPSRISTAMAWVSVKRGVPTLTFKEFSEGVTVADMYVDEPAEPEADAVDPTQPTPATGEGPSQA
jgi:hypothetical protein